MIVLDVWGGEQSLDHVARFILDDSEVAMKLGIIELEAGFLVNLRKDTDFSLGQTFDDRIGGTA